MTCGYCSIYRAFWPCCPFSAQALKRQSGGAKALLGEARRALTAGSSSVRVGEFVLNPGVSLGSDGFPVVTVDDGGDLLFEFIG